MKTEFEILLKEALKKTKQVIKELPKETLAKRLEQSKNSTFALALAELNKFLLTDIFFSEEREEILLLNELSSCNFIFIDCFSQVEIELSEFKLISANDDFYSTLLCENLLAA